MTRMNRLIVPTFIFFVALASSNLSVLAQGKGKPGGGGGCTTHQVPTTDAKCYFGAGCLDSTFGTLGTSIGPFSSPLVVGGIEKVFVQPDGKLIVIGFGAVFSSTGGDLLVGRLNADGSPDTTFGTNGFTLVDIGSQDDVGSSGVLLADGRILAGGYESTNYTNGVTRLLPDGTVDASFGTNGKINIPRGELWLQDMAVQADGKIILAGGGPQFTAARLNPNGSLDSSFGTGGIASHAAVSGVKGASAQNYAVALQPQAGGGERIVLGGWGMKKANGFANFNLVALSPSGAIDTSFGVSGRTLTEFSDGASIIFDLAIDSDNKIVAAGRVTTSCNGLDLAFAGYTASGSLDSAFSGDGKLTQDVYGGPDNALAVAIQSDGKIVAAGFARTIETNINNTDFLVIRLNPNGSLDSGFGPGLSGFYGLGIVTTDLVGPSSSIGYGLAIQADGKLVVAGSANYGGSNFAVARYLP